MYRGASNGWSERWSVSPLLHADSCADDAARVWLVVYDIQTKQVIAALRETTWNLTVDSSNPNPQTATPLGTDFVPIDALILQPSFANKAPRMTTEIPVGNAVWTFTNPNHIHD
jgi:hypothetical protein